LKKKNLNNLQIIKKSYNPISLKRRDEVVLNRLRIGHTHYTHAYLMKKEPPKYAKHAYIQPQTHTSIQNVETRKRPDKNTT